MHLFGHELDPTLTEDSVVLPLLLVSLVRLQEHSTNSDIKIFNWSYDVSTTDEPAKFRKEGCCLSNVHTLWDTVMAQYGVKEIHEILIVAAQN